MMARRQTLGAGGQWKEWEESIEGQAIRTGVFGKKEEAPCPFEQGASFWLSRGPASSVTAHYG